MVLLQAIWNSPFFILAALLLVAGFASLLSNTFRAVSSGNKKFGKTGEQRRENRITSKMYILALILILFGVIFFIYWMGKTKND